MTLNYSEVAPAADLAHAVERYWFIESSGDAVQRVYPDGHAELAIHLGNCVQGQSKCLLIGQMTQWVDLAPGGSMRVFGVHLKPEAAMAVAAGGRDHHKDAFSLWMAGGGVKRGCVFGESDEFGVRTVRDAVHVHDLQATILHLLGLDHTRLTYRHNGRAERLTDVAGNVIAKALA